MIRNNEITKEAEFLTEGQIHLLTNHLTAPSLTFVLYVFELRAGVSFRSMMVSVIVDVAVAIVSVTVTLRGKLV